MNDLLIISPAMWQNDLKSFVRYKNDTGIRATLATIEDIDQNYNGRDLPEKIKRAIESQHRSFGVRYVMLVGDVDRFPVRYVRAINTEWGTKWYPSDLYYADLYDSMGQFNDWDFDHDGIYGEIDFKGGGLSGTNLDRINMVPDVTVGRLPASNQAELLTYIQKVMTYEFAARESIHFNYDSDWFKKALFVVDGGSSPFGDETLSDQYAAPLSQAGISIQRRYQDDPPWSTPPPGTPQQEQAAYIKRAAEITRMLDSGVGFFCYFGHGHVRSFSGWYSANDVATLNNRDHLPVIYAISCLTARFHFDYAFDQATYEDVNGGDWTGGGGNRPEPAPVQPTKHDRDSMAEEFLVKRDTGAVAYIGTTSKIEHGGKNLAKYFFESYRNMPKPPTLGAMWQDALSRFAQTDALQGMGGYYAFIHIHKVMLFGDPSLRVGGIQYIPWYSTSAVIQPEIIQEAIIR